MNPYVYRSAPRGAWRLLAAWLLSAAGLCGSGCGDVTSYRDYAQKSMQTSCERTFRCCNRRCSTSVDSTFNGSLKNIEYAINNGLQTFNAAQAQACLDAATTLYTDCTQYAATVDTTAASRACTGILQGALPVGVACSQTNDYCAPSTYCAIDSSSDPPQARCRRMVNIGETCDTSSRCVAGSSCGGTSPRVCTATTQLGAKGDTCNIMAPCGSSLVCLNGLICGAPQEGGKPCTANTQCLSGRCAVDTCTVPMSKPTTVSDLICGGSTSI